MELDKMDQSPLNILLVEDNPGDVFIIKDLLKTAFPNYSLVHSSFAKEAIQLISEKEFDVIILDLGLPDSTGTETLKKIQVSKVKAPVIVLTGLDDDEAAITSVREGAQDYLVKSKLNTEYIQHVIRYSIERKKIQEIQKKHTRQFSILSDATSSIYESDDMVSIYRIICNSISGLLNRAVVIVIEFNENGDISIADVESQQSFSEQIHQTISKDLSGKYLKNFSLLPEINIDKFNLFKDGRIHVLDVETIEPGLGIFKPEICLAAQELLGVKYIYIAGFTKNDKCFGGIIILLNVKIDNDDLNIIDAIKTQTSLCIQRKNVEAELKVSENRYRNLFNESPVPTWEKDYCEIKKEIDILKASGVTDLRKYLNKNPGKIREWKSKIEIKDLNQAALDLYNATDRKQYMDHECEMITQEPKNDFIQEIEMIFEGKTKFDFERELYTVDGNKKNVIKRWTITEGFRESLERVLVSVTDISELKSKEKDLRTSREQIRNLAAHIQNVREEDRISLAREIHDELGQILTAIKIDVGLLKKKLAGNKEFFTTEEFSTELNSIYDTVDTVLKTVRKILTELRPEILDSLGLEEAIKSYAFDYLERFNVECKINVDLPEIKINQEQKIALYRIMQETLTNVVRHSEATSVVITLKKKKGKLILEIQDNGIGMADISKSGSYGIIGMRERVFLLDGDLQINSEPGKGTSVLVEIPLTKKKMVNNHVS